MQNTSPTQSLIFLEIFKAPKFVDFSATQWSVPHLFLARSGFELTCLSLCRLALTPPQVVADLLNISVETVENFKKQKQIIVA